MKIKTSGSSLVGLSEAQRKRRIMEKFRQAQALATGDREKLIEDLKTEIRGYELRNKLESSELKEAIDGGKIRETEEVARWLLAYEIIQKLRAVSDTTGIV